jgi:hypothetical protein
MRQCVLLKKERNFWYQKGASTPAVQRKLKPFYVQGKMGFKGLFHFIDGKPQGAADYWKGLGFHAALGGKHVKWGTHNALFYAKDCYIEWLALEKLEIAQQANHPLTSLLLHDTLGFGTVCIRTTAIEELNGRLKDEGLETSGVLDAERRTAEGKLIKWKMLFVEEEVSEHLPSPFFIEWQENDAARFESLRKSGILQPENEAMEMEKCVFGVRDVEAASEKWKKLLGGSLELANCEIEFRHTDWDKERLEQVVFKGARQKVTFEEGVYWMPPQGNNNSK